MAQNVSNPYQFNIVLPTKFSTSPIQEKPILTIPITLTPSQSLDSSWVWLGYYSPSYGGEVKPTYGSWKYPISRLCWELVVEGSNVIHNRYIVGIDFNSSNIGSWRIDLFGPSDELLFSIPNYTEILGNTAYFYADASDDYSDGSNFKGFLLLLYDALPSSLELELKIVLYQN